MSMPGREPDVGQRQELAPSPSDSWEFDPDVEVPNERYRGARRADVPRHRRNLRSVGVITAVLVVVTAVAIWVATTGGPAGRNAEWAGGATPDRSGVGSSPSGSALPSSTATASPGATTAAGQVRVFEAEAGMPDVKLRAAQVVTMAGASGGRVVRFTSNAGEIELRGIVVPASATYRFTIYYAPGAEATGRLAVGRAAPLTVNYATGSGCCSVATVDASIPAGTHSAAISMSTGDGAPAIDRIEVSRT